MGEEGHKITVVTFYAFGTRQEAAFVNKTDDEINKEIAGICNTNHIVSSSYYTAKLIETKQFNDESRIIEEQKA